MQCEAGVRLCSTVSNGVVSAKWHVSLQFPDREAYGAEFLSVPILWCGRHRLSWKWAADPLFGSTEIVQTQCVSALKHTESSRVMVFLIRDFTLYLGNDFFLYESVNTVENGRKLEGPWCVGRSSKWPIILFCHLR
jgi:hypothetical protein